MTRSLSLNFAENMGKDFWPWAGGRMPWTSSIKCGDAPGLEKIKDHCLETGDAFLLGRLGSPQDPKTWRQLAERALDQGKFRFARRAYELAGDPDKAAMVEGLIAGANTANAADAD